MSVAMSRAVSVGRDVFSTIGTPLPAPWTTRVDTPPRALSGLERLRYIVSVGSSYPRVVLDGSEGTTSLIAATFLARRRRRPAIVIADATWKVGRNPLDHLASHLGLFPLVGSHVRYCVLSTDERDRFPHTWRVERERVLFTPYHYWLSDEELAAPVVQDGTVFAGGDSMRDYRVLAVAARELPAQVRIATRRAAKQLADVDLPPNLVVSQLSVSEYNRRTASASVVVVPLRPRPDRGSGQTTYLNAMALGKALVVTDVAGVRDYITNGETGLIVPPGDARRLAAAIRTLLDDPEYALRIGAAARREALQHFGPGRYAQRLLEAVDEAWAWE
jgi:Glycosyl transferases group 1